MPQGPSLTFLVGIGIVIATQLSGCGDTQGIRVTTIQVEATTTGAATDPDGYTAVVDPSSSSPSTSHLDPTGSVAFPLVVEGNHVVELGDIASNCSTSDNPRQVAATAGETVPVVFQLTCTGAPTIVSLTFPDTISSAPGTDNVGTVGFTDPDGNITLFILQNVTDPANPSQPVSSDPGVSGSTQGTFTFHIGCQGPSPCQSGPETWTMVLQDADANTSQPFVFSFEVAP
jgi:hypothetical protein